MNYTQKRFWGKVVYHIVVGGFAIVMLYPLLWMVFSSFKDTNVIFREAASLIPSEWHFENFSNGWKGFGGVTFTTFYKNSFIISILATVGAVFSSALTAFGFSRIKFRGSGFWFLCMMLTLMIPFQVVMVPQFIIFQNIGWVGTYLPLIVPHFFGGAFFIFLDIQFINGIPKDLDEAAYIDGCSIYRIFATIIMPLIVPALVTCGIFSFIWRWDDFLASLLYLNKPSTYTISIALKMFSDPSAQSDWGAMFAMATLSLMPVFIIFLVFQKYLVEGISTSGMKG